MINNRQAGRRNRGRNNNNNGRSGGQNRGGNDNGNRIDSRARGNAAQLLEKYRNMARDAQLSGDRVNAEYYLQFADHYFRVLADNRARQEEAQGIQRERQPQRPWDPESDGDEFDGADGNADYEDRGAYAQQGNGQRESRDNNRDNGRDNNRDNGRDNREQGQRDGNRDNRDNNRDRDQNRRDRQPQGQYQPQAQAQPYAQPRREETVDEAPVQAAPVQQAPVQADAAEPPRRGRGRPPRQPRVEISEPAARSEDGSETGDGAASSDAERPRRGLRQRRPRDEAVENDEPVGLDLAVLPPAIARADNDSAGGEEAAAEAPRKRPRARRPAATEAAE